MIELDITYYILFFVITAIQSIAGVGVLVLGTPLLLLLNHNIIDSISILLPLSILTSFTNLSYFNFFTKKKFKNIQKDILNTFFTFGILGMMIGIVLLKNFHDDLNFKIIVSIIILISILLKNIKKNANEVSNKLSSRSKQIILFITGLIHGLTNSGGSLLSLFFLQLNNNDKNQSRYEITFFYLFLAIAQYLLFMLIINNTFYVKVFFQLSIIAFLGILAGNLYFKYFNKKYFKYLVEFLAFVSAILLITNHNS